MLSANAPACRLIGDVSRKPSICFLYCFIFLTILILFTPYEFINNICIALNNFHHFRTYQFFQIFQLPPSSHEAPLPWVSRSHKCTPLAVRILLDNGLHVRNTQDLHQKLYPRSGDLFLPAGTHPHNDFRLSYEKS